MTPREAWILENLVPAVVRAASEKEGRTLRPEEAYALLRAADPSRNAGATAWLARIYPKEGFRLEDLEGGPASKAAQTLELFERKRRALPAVERSLTRHGSLASLYRAVSGTSTGPGEEAVTPAGRERRRMERARARAESRILREDDVATIAVPLTEAAARWWGRGTRWCTAAENNNAFRHYVQAPLVVVTFAGGIRMQFWSCGHQAQAMDGDDAPLERGAIKARWSVLGPVLLWMEERFGGVLHLLPRRAISQAMVEHAVDRAPRQALRMLDLPWLDHGSLLLRAVRRDAAVFRVIPAARRTPALSRLAISLDPGLLVVLPEKERTEELCDLALGLDPKTLRWVPSALATEARRRDAVERDGAALSCIPPSSRTKALCLLALRTNPFAFEWSVPVCLIDRGMCTEAVSRDGMLLRSVPSRFVDGAMCRLAVSCKGRAVAHVPSALLDEAMVETAFGQTAEALAYVPERFVTESMALRAVEEGFRAFRLPRRLSGRDFVDRLLRLDPRNVRVIHPDFRDEGMWRRALVDDPGLVHAMTHAERQAWAPEADDRPTEQSDTNGTDKTGSDVRIAWSPEILDELAARIDQGMAPCLACPPLP